MQSNLKTIFYDVFISTPMAAWTDNKIYQKQRNDILSIRDTLKSVCKFNKVFYAGSEITNAEFFDSKDTSARDDFDALRCSKQLLCIYPEKLASGTLVEVGAAIALNIPTLILVPSRKTLPYILEQADAAFDFVKIYEVTGSIEIIQLITASGPSLFPTKPKINW